jgi:hypothetical protein
MSEEGESVNENINLTSKEEVPGVSEYESETVSPVTDEGAEGREETEIATDTATIEGLPEEESEQLETSAIEQPSPPSQTEIETIPKRQKPKAKNVDKIQKTLVETSNQLVKQTTQINKINQSLQSLQKQMKANERQAGIVNQLRSQINQIQRQIIQVHKSVQKRPTTKLQSGKKMSRNKKKSKK